MKTVIFTFDKIMSSIRTFKRFINNFKLILVLVIVDKNGKILSEDNYVIRNIENLYKLFISVETIIKNSDRNSSVFFSFYLSVNGTVKVLEVI